MRLKINWDLKSTGNKIKSTGLIYHDRWHCLNSRSFSFFSFWISIEHHVHETGKKISYKKN